MLDGVRVMMMAMIENKSERREISVAHVFTPEIFRSTVAKLLKMAEYEKGIKLVAARSHRYIVRESREGKKRKRR